MKTIKTVLTLAIATPIILWSCGKTKTVKTGDAEDAAKAGEQSAVYVVDPGASSLKWVGKKVTGQHNGTIGIASGEVNVEKGDIKAGKFTIDMNTITVVDLTDAEKNGKLRGHLMHADFFDVSNHTTSTFEITGVTKLDKAGPDGETHEVKGNLTIKGISKNITIPAKVTITADELKADAKFAVDRTEWDIKYGSGKFMEGLGDNMINDAFELELVLVAKVKK